MTRPESSQFPSRDSRDPCSTLVARPCARAQCSGMGSGQSVRADPSAGHLAAQNGNGGSHAAFGEKHALPECHDLTQLSKTEALRTAIAYLDAVMPTCQSAEAQKLLGRVADLLQDPMMDKAAGGVATLDEKSSRTTRLEHSASPGSELRLLTGAGWIGLARSARGRPDHVAASLRDSSQVDGERQGDAGVPDEELRRGE